MKNQKTSIIDFVAMGETPDEWRMVLVEEGPWQGPLEGELRRVQDRLYDCLEAAIDGQLAELFPESAGKRVVVQLDCYNLPRSEIQQFFERFSEGVFQQDDFCASIASSKFVTGIEFELNFDNIH